MCGHGFYIDTLSTSSGLGYSFFFVCWNISVLNSPRHYCHPYFRYYHIYIFFAGICSGGGWVSAVKPWWMNKSPSPISTYSQECFGRCAACANSQDTSCSIVWGMIKKIIREIKLHLMRRNNLGVCDCIRSRFIGVEKIMTQTCEFINLSGRALPAH